MRSQVSIHKEEQAFTLILAGLIICGLFIMTSVCLAASDEWAEKQDMPTARMDLSASAVDGNIYAIGGQKRWFVDTLAAVEVYDPVRDVWDKKANMLNPRWKLSTCVVDGKIYAIGGWTGNAGGFAHTTVEEYDPKTDVWTKKADMMMARSGFAASAVDGKIYAIGGWDKTFELSIVEEYDTMTDTWTRKADMPTARGDMDSAVVDDIIYVFGGYPPLSVVEAYDPATDTWMKKADMEAGMCLYSAEAVNGKIYLIGGWDGIGDWEASVPLAAVQEYDPTTDTWTKKADMPTPRLELGTSVINGRIYAIGGAAAADLDQGVATVEEYTPEGWSVSSQGKLTTMWGSVKRCP